MKKILLIALIVTSAITAAIVGFQVWEKDPKSLVSYQVKPCMEGTEKSTGKDNEETIEVKDVYARPHVNKGDKVKALMNWYGCHKVETGDLVLYRYSTNQEPVIRIARATPGDRFKLVKAKDRDAWNIEVNGDLVEAEGKPYFFGTDQVPPLGLYEKANRGILQPNHAIILSAFPPGYQDSGLFGVVSIDDLIAKVVPASK